MGTGGSDVHKEWVGEFKKLIIPGYKYRVGGILYLDYDDIMSYINSASVKRQVLEDSIEVYVNNKWTLLKLLIIKDKDGE